MSERIIGYTEVPDTNKVTISIERYDELLKKEVVYDLLKRDLTKCSKYITQAEELLFEIEKKGDEE